MGMFKEILFGPEEDVPTPQMIIDLTRRIRSDKTEEKAIYTYAILKGALKSGVTHTAGFICVSNLRGNAVSYPLNYYVNESVRSIEEKIMTLSLDGESDFTPSYSNGRSIIEYLERTKLPDIIFEYGVTDYSDGQRETYFVLHHTKDTSTSEALYQIHAVISPFGGIL